MAFDRILIAPINNGLVTNSRSWIQPNDAFEYMQNMYVFRQRIRKRFGSQMMGTTPLNTRLRTSLVGGGAGVGITNAGGVASGNVRTILADATLPLAMGQTFSVGSQVFTVISNAAGPQPMLPIATGSTFNVTTGDFVINTDPVVGLTTVFFYPSFPVMGIDQYFIDSINNHPTYAFDTRYAYTFSGGGWSRAGATRWLGDNTKYFWTSNWESIAGDKRLFVTNFNASIGAPGANDDPMYYFDGTTFTNFSTVTKFLTAGAGNFVRTARIIVPFKNRLVLLNTIETDAAGTANKAYVNRCRYSINGSPIAATAWLEPNQTGASGAGYIDASSEESIISCGFVKDRLIVYFERSTWELAYTGNEILPFVWQKINDELGSQSTFSSVEFDQFLLTTGNTGFHSCNGSNVARIDDKIPNKIFEFEATNNAPIRTCGIRDYYTEMVYWAFISDDNPSTSIFPNQVMAYNYKNNTWSVNDDCFTSFGYFEQSSDITWASSAPVTWEQFNGAWNSNVFQANQRQILGGTPEGFILQLNSEMTRNAPSMYITNMTFSADGVVTLTIIDHNLDATPTELEYGDDFILIENVVGDAGLMAALNGKIFDVEADVPATKDTIRINTRGTVTSGTYSGSGTCARVSNPQLITKNFNPYVDQNRSVYVSKVDFAVQKTVYGKMSVDYYTSTAPLSMVEEGQASGAILGNSVLETYPYNSTLYPLEQYQELLWHPVYLQSSGEFIQLILHLNLEQIMDPQIALSPFELEAIVLHCQKSSDRMQ